MPQGHRGFLVRERVGTAGRRAEDGAFEVFVQVAAADAAPRDVDLHRPGAEFRFRNVLDARRPRGRGNGLPS